MPPHLKRRDFTYYLVDGDLRKSLKTSKKGVAEYLLDQYVKGKYGMVPTPTVKQFYERWIQTKVEPLFRRALIRDYRQAFNCYILPAFGDTRLLAIGNKELTDFRLSLLRKGLSVKTCRNIIDGSFRALYRDARADLEDLKGRDPFLDVQWPAAQRRKPDPFTAEERDRVLALFHEREPLFYPLVSLVFLVGLRPSEAAALLRSDIDVERCEISITKSRHLGAEARTKTTKSERAIRVPDAVIEALLTLPSFQLGADRVFLNKIGAALDVNQWARFYWARMLKAIGVRYRKFYATRHTFITEMVKRGELLKAIADYCGTSVAMIEADYCGVLTLSDRTVFAQSAANYAKSMVVPTGIEPVFPT